MKIGIMQPYFFPYIGYFSLIQNVDQFILLDEVQFIRHGWIERNRILKPKEGWQYISIPLKKHSQKTLIKDMEVCYTPEWRRRFFAQLTHYTKAPFYKQTIELLDEIFNQDFREITQVNQRSLEKICQYLGIETPIYVFSQMELAIEKVTASDEWALNICKVLPDVTEYWNPPGGQNFFVVEKFKKKQNTYQIYPNGDNTIPPGTESLLCTLAVNY